MTRKRKPHASPKTQGRTFRSPNPGYCPPEAIHRTATLHHPSIGGLPPKGILPSWPDRSRLT